MFRGGWSLPAAEAVAGTELEDIDELLNELRRSGLVARVPGVVPTRYRMLQAVRDHGRARHRGRSLTGVNWLDMVARPPTVGLCPYRVTRIGFRGGSCATRPRPR